AARETSTCAARATPSSFSISATVSCAPASLTSATTTAAPCWAKRSAAARPCPDAAPVISATFPRRRLPGCMAGTVNNDGRKRQRTMRSVADDPITELRALFVRDGDHYVPTELARGPWDPNALHGGAPSALFAHACEHHDPSSADFLARLTVELL